MTADPAKKPRVRNRKQELDRNKLTRAQKREAQDAAIMEMERLVQIQDLAERTSGQPTDADGDIDFAYRNSANPKVMPVDAPSLGAWQWYVYAIENRKAFLEICAKREDAKAKQAGIVSNQRMEDDRRQQFAVIDRIVAQLELDIKGIADDIMVKFPEDLLHACRKHKEQWKAYFRKFPITDDEING